MVARWSALVAAGMWLVLGILLVLLGAIFISLHHLPCTQSTSFCDDLYRVVQYDVLLGQVNINSIQTLMWLLPIIVIIGATMLFCSVQQIRFFMSAQPLGVISFSLGFHTLILILFLLINVTLGQAVAYWQGELQTTNDGHSLNGQAISDEQWQRIQSYSIATANIRLVSIILGIAVFGLTTALYFYPLAPPRELRLHYLGQRNQCGQCGLVSSGADPPSCALCLKYFQLVVDETDRLSFTPGAETTMNVLIKPMRGRNIPVGKVRVEIRFPKELEINLPTTPGWVSSVDALRQNKLVLDGPDYLTRIEGIPLSIKVKPEIRQRKLTTCYELSLEVRNGENISQSVNRFICVRREYNGFEKLLFGVRRGIGQLIHLTVRTSARGAQSVRNSAILRSSKHHTQKQAEGILKRIQSIYRLRIKRVSPEQNDKGSSP